jgi:hypothetical protein
MDWLTTTLISALAVYLLERLGRLAAANRRMRNDQLAVIDAQLKALLAQAAQGNAQAQAAIRTRAQTLMRSYQGVLDRIKEIEDSKNGVVAVAGKIWSTARSIIGVQ